jgi:hypothetical protein
MSEDGERWVAWLLSTPRERSEFFGYRSPQ